jgi:hypothetical protein
MQILPSQTDKDKDQSSINIILGNSLFVYIVSIFFICYLTAVKSADKNFAVFRIYCSNEKR